MKKEIKCKSCNLVKEVILICDNCGKKDYTHPIHLEFSYPDILDETEYDFCNLDCLIVFVTKENSKRKSKESRFIFGKNKEDLK